jgi:hypothetical protein
MTTGWGDDDGGGEDDGGGWGWRRGCGDEDEGVEGGDFPLWAGVKKVASVCKTAQKSSGGFCYIAGSGSQIW